MKPMADTEIHRSFGRVEGKIDLILAQNSAHERRLDALDTRISKVEGRLMYGAGAIAVLSSLFAVLVKPLLTKLFGW